MATRQTALIIGASGVVGRGICRSLAAADWDVIGVGRDSTRLEQLRQDCPSIRVVRGSVADDASAPELAERVRALGVSPSAIVTSVNVPLKSFRLLDATTAELDAVVRGNLLIHHVAIRALLPLLAPGGRYIGIGGGMADAIFDGMGAVSICQAGQRNMFRFYARETAPHGVSVVELMLLSVIVDPADDATADPRLIRADEVGQHVRAVLEQPDIFAGPILALKSRKQIGQPERPAT